MTKVPQEPPAATVRCGSMHYVIYLAVATPLLLGWLFWSAAHIPPQPPLFAAGLENLSTKPLREAGPVPAPSAHATRKLARIEASRTE